MAKVMVGPADDPTCSMTVINERSMKSILAYAETGKQEGRVLTAAGDGYSVAPTVIADMMAHPPRRRSSDRSWVSPRRAIWRIGLTGAVYTDGSREGEDGSLRRQSLHQPQVRGRRRSPPLRRLQYVGTNSKAGGPAQKVS
ncbi:MAG: hypothetical protein QM757_23875 [Paludibaculum sp.]